MTIEQMQKLVPAEIKVYKRRKYIDFYGEKLYLDTVTLRKGRMVIRIEQDEVFKGADKYVERRIKEMVEKLYKTTQSSPRMSPSLIIQS